MSFKKGFFKSISNVAIFTYSTVFLELISTIILSRILLPKVYGFFAIITLFSGFIQLFSDNGIFQALVRSKYGHTFHRHLFNLSVWIGLFLSLILVAFAYPISVIYNDPGLFIPTIVLSFRFLFDSMNYVPMAMQVKELNFKHTGSTKLFTALLSISLSIVMALLGFSYWALVIPTVLEPLFQFAGHYYHTRFGIKIYSLKAAYHTFKKIRSLMGNLTLNNTIGYWARNADKLIIGKVYTQADLGLYGRAFRFQQLSHQLISGVFNNVLFPSLKKLQEQGGNIQKEYADILGIVTLINFPIYAVLILAPQLLVNILWGATWIQVASYLPYVGIIILFMSIITTTTNVFIIFQKEHILTRVTIATSVVNILAVIAGSFTSMQNMLLFVTIGTVAINVPIYIYFAFYKSFSFNLSLILKFWIPKLIIGSALIASTYFKTDIITACLLLVLFLHLIINQWSALINLISTIRNKLKKSQ